ITARMSKKQVLAVKSEGARWQLPPGHPIREIITARMEKKASFGRKIRGGSPDSRENYGQNGEKSKFCP
ncbi:MAG: hypothetical protein MRZ84_03145, partial [Eubacterium sp.]|nr:hypothetical protein [Eubacterium sp.]